ncbi:YlbD family protein [Gracilibacillus salinarum]|uniref:YlbD family protein n=1 Tax=Gracilibacillus salinarum TaxID=2932255 RepID=A0ABY4GME6_9BACI|nr:YlbD family protein [Gracilibacillus salinarum]UOQ85467.1 YlbD family protein [Gracilibacillus salinarum]
MKNSSNPSVQQFKLFIQDHPLLLKQVRQGNMTMQEAYEQYMLLGDDDPSWKNYQKKVKKDSENSEEESTSNQLYQKVWKHIEELDINKVETHINDLNGAIDNVLTLIGQFKQFRSKNQSGTGQSSDQFFFHPKD